MRTHRKLGAAAGAPLSVRDKFFYSGDTPWVAIESSDFTLYKRHLEGEDITPVLRERNAIGFNLLRVWLLNTSVIGQVFPGGLLPSQYPDFYARLPEFAHKCGDFGLYVEFGAFTQPGTLMPNADDQKRHLDNVVAALIDTPYIGELVNEYNSYPDSDVASSTIVRPSSGIWSRGSGGADVTPPQPVWDWTGYHTNGLDQWQRKTGHNTMEWADSFKVAGIANENTRYTDNDNSLTHAYDAAAGASLLCAGACFHSNSGKFSTLFTAAESDAAVKWVKGAKSVPLEYRVGQYIHRDDRESATVIRSYERRLPDGRSWIVDIRA